MKHSEINLEIKVSWWFFKIYIPFVNIISTLTGRLDEEKVERMLDRAIKIKVKSV